MRRFVSAPIEPQGSELFTPAADGEPPLPARFRWSDRDIVVKAVLRTWRSTKTDRGDVYLKRHWFEIETEDGERAEVYFDRGARRGAARWWLYTFAAPNACE